MVNMAQQKQRLKFGAMLLNPDDHQNDSEQDERQTSNDNSTVGSPYAMSPWSQASPFANSPWVTASPATVSTFGLVGSLVREEGHVYSLAVSGDLLYTGSESKNIRVWKNLKEYTGFKSNSGLVKAIVIAGSDKRIFTGHQDGKIRVWRISRRDPKLHRRLGSLPSFGDALKSSVNPRNYVEVRRNKKNVLKIRHFDAVSSMSLDEEEESGAVLYSGSWDKTVKAWRVSSSKCLDSFEAHDDAVNAVAVAPNCLVLTGSADGTIKVWRREIYNKTDRRGSQSKSEKAVHTLVQTLLRQESAVTAVVHAEGVVYGGSSDGLVNFWELRGKRFSHGGTLRGHRLAVLCLAVTVGGSLVMSGSADKSICVWRRDTSGDHACLSVLTGHSGPVKCLAVERDDENDSGEWVVYSGSLDRSVKVWRVSEHAPDMKQLRAWDQHFAGETYAPSPRRSARLGQKTLLRQY